DWFARVADGWARTVMDPPPRHPRRVRMAICATALAHKLVTCPMCAGFWIGLAWARAGGVRGADLLAHGFASSIASALGVAAWQAVAEAHEGARLWRYLNTPPAGVHLARVRAAERQGMPPEAILCPHPGCKACAGTACNMNPDAPVTKAERPWIIIRIKTDGQWPTSDEMAIRDDVENAVKASDIGEVKGTDAGDGSMSIAVRAEHPATAAVIVKSIADSLGIADRTTIE